MASLLFGLLNKCQAGASEPFHQVHNEALRQHFRGILDVSGR